MILKESTYRPPFIFKNGHINTVYRTLITDYPVDYKRRRISTPDGDFLDLDLLINSSDKAVILIHGLEGSSKSNYVRATANYLFKNGFDVIAMNLRSCSGEPNLTLGTYHSGKTDDLDTVIRFVKENYTYQDLYLAGYSLGGNQILKYLGEKHAFLNSDITAAVTVSAPCDLEGSSKSLARYSNKLYMNRFLKTLKEKSVEKLERFPELGLNREKILNAKNFYDFDNAVTAPIYGYKNAQDYWEKNSSKHFIPDIKTPALLLTAKDDPFLSDSCYPVQEAENHPYFFLELNTFGGHVGFNDHTSMEKNNWMVQRILSFFKNLK